MLARGAARTRLETICRDRTNDGSNRRPTRLRTDQPDPPAPRILVLETMPPTGRLGPDSSGTGWLRRLLPEPKLCAVSAYDGQTPLPDPAGFAAAIVPGSIAAVYE